MPLSNQVQLIAYPDRIGSRIADLAEFIERHLASAVGGVHLLPPFPSNADGGFSPLTHREIDSRVGSWADVERLSARLDVCLDLVLNHIADDSPEFRDYIAHGKASPHAALFVDVDGLGEITPDDLAKIHIRKEKEPFRDVVFADGTKGRVWCTFTERQVDLDFRAPQTFDLMRGNIECMAAHGVRMLRLDAFGYVTKRIGTSCFLVEPEVWETLEWFRETCGAHGIEVLPEVHDHPSYQYAIADRGMWAYGFALPPLVLHALLDCDSRHLKNWLRMCPHNQVTVLDTHDGICIPDVEGFLPPKDLQALIDNVDERSADPIMRRSAARAHSVGAIYQLTCTFFEALQCNEDAYIAARAIQLFAPGIPQVYYVGLLAGTNDFELMERTGELRDINRRYYSVEEAVAALGSTVARRQLRLMELRNTHPAFSGRFELEYSNDSSVAMMWRSREAFCHVFIDLNFRTVSVRCSGAEGEESFRG